MTPRALICELTALVVPPACAVCRAPLAAAGEALCSGCRAGLPWLPADRCPRCGLPPPCAPCPAARAAFDAAWAPMAYDGCARAAVAALKRGRALALVDVMAAQIAANAPPGLLAGRTIAAVPADPGRRRARGFDQADRLARALSRRAQRPFARCLRRSGRSGRQTGASRRERLASGLRLAVVARGPAPGWIALVDDVHTTGATLDACSRALRAAGTPSVVCLTWARTLRA